MCVCVCVREIERDRAGLEPLLNTLHSLLQLGLMETDGGISTHCTKGHGEYAQTDRQTLTDRQTDIFSLSINVSLLLPIHLSLLLIFYQKVLFILQHSTLECVDFSFVW